MAAPAAVEVRTAPLFSVRLAAEPGVVVTLMALAPALIEPSASDWSSLKVRAPNVPEVWSVPTRLLPVRVSVPAPLSASVPAVMTPAPESVAPLATTVVAVPVPTFSEPVRLSVPATTVVVPV